MKKFTLVALAMMASASCFAQTTPTKPTTLWDGEDTNITSGEHAGFWGDANPVLVENTQTDGINTSAHCLMFKITKGGTNNTVKLPFKNWIKPSMNGSKRVSLMIRKANPENVIVQLSDPTDGSKDYWNNQATWYGGDDKWQKLVFDFTANGDFDKPGVMSITPQAGNIDGDQIVYIDNIVIEDAPKINGKLFSEYNAENPITGDLKLTGAWMKGSSMNVDDNWKSNTYNDFEYFHSQATDGVTSIDMRKASTIGVDINQFFKNPNTIVYANENYKHANVVVGADGTGTANSLELTDAKAFNAPYKFKAESVKLTRDVQSKINSFVLPFEVTADELGATKVATYASNNKNGDKTVYFDKVAEVAANTPFLAEFLGDKNELSFSDKTIAVTPESLGTNFVGVYVPQNAEGKYGIDGEGKLHKGGATATIDAFHAYLNVTGSAAPAGVAFNGSTPTAINGVAADKVADTAVYDLSGRRVYGKLQKGLYIVNGKKVVVK